MSFTTDELARLAAWEPLTAGFGIDPESSQTRAVVDAIAAFRETLESAEMCVHVVEDGALSNYVGFFLHNRPCAAGRWSGLMVYLSLLCPVAVFAEASAYGSATSAAYSGIEPHQVLTPSQTPESPLEEVLHQALKATPHRFLSAPELSQLLPIGIVPYEYCLSTEPWNTAFHVLFSNTD